MSATGQGGSTGTGYDGSRIKPGTRLNGVYEIERLIARGGMGEVYAGRAVETDVPVAIKMIRPELSADPAIIGRAGFGVIDHVGRALGKPLRPSSVYCVDQIPKTRNGKLLRRLVRSAYLGTNPGDLSTVENPASIDQVANCRKVL